MGKKPFGEEPEIGGLTDRLCWESFSVTIGGLTDRKLWWSKNDSTTHAEAYSATCQQKFHFCKFPTAREEWYYALSQESLACSSCRAQCLRFS